MVGALCEIRNLRKTFHWSDWQGFWLRRRSLSALAGVDLEVRAGECLALIGESGSGKTTMARCLLGLETADSGEIRLAGTDLTTLPRSEQKEARRRVQMVFQNSAGALDPRWRIERSIAEGVAKERATREEIASLLDLVGLAPEIAERFPHQLSGGQRQRVCIARALAADPELLILDEPVSALDAAIRSRILELLAELRQRLGLTLIFIGHDLPVVAKIADRVAVMYLGRVVEVGTVDEIFRRPRHPYTAGLLASAPSLTRSFAAHRQNRLQGEIPSAIDPPQGCVFHPRCPLQETRCRTTEPDLAAAQNHAVACYFPLSRDAPHRQEAGADSVTFDE